MQKQSDGGSHWVGREQRRGSRDASDEDGEGGENTKGGGKRAGEDVL